MVFGPVEAGPDTNPNSGYIGSDYQKWDHIKFSTTYPWISYNGAFEVFDSVQFDSVYGPQILRVLSSGGENQPYNWQISMPEMENTTGSVGWRIMGQGMTVNRATLCSTSAPGIIDTDFSTFSNTACGGNLYVYGETNTVNFSGNDTNTSYMLGVTDGGAGNTVNGAYNSSPYQQRQATVNQAYTRSRGKDYVNGTVTPDFVRSGNVSTPYFSDKDLFFWPEDMLWNGAGANVFSDATSLTSRYIKIPSSARISRFKGFIGDNANIGNSAAGSQVPAANVAVYVSAKCPSITSYTLAVYAGATSVTSATFTCTASYTTQQIPVNLSSYSGQTLQFNFSAGEVDVAWIAVRPYQTDYNGYQPSDSTGVWTANARSWSWSGSGHPGNADGTSPYGFSTSLSPAWALTYVNGSNNLNGGAIYRPVPSTVSYLVAAPTVLTDTLGAAMASGDTSITLAAGTTSSWANNGCLQVDQEIVCYSGTPAVGTTTLTVTRGQYGTLAQAHSNGATLSSVGTGTFYTACNSVNYAVTNVVFTPAWTYFKSPFAAQNCSGYATSFKLGAGNGPTGQLYNIAAVQVAQAPQIGTATAANQVPLSSGSGPYTWTSTKAVTGSGAAIPTGPTSSTSGNIVTYTGTSGQQQDSGTALVNVLTTAGGKTLSTANTLSGLPSGCQQLPCLVASLSQQSYSGTAGSNAGAYVPMLAAASNPGGMYRMCYFIQVTVAGTGGTFQGWVNFFSNGNGQSDGVTGTVSTTAQWNLSYEQTCAAFYSDASTNINYLVYGSGVTGTPTIVYDVSLERLQ